MHTGFAPPLTAAKVKICGVTCMYKLASVNSWPQWNAKLGNTQRSQHITLCSDLKRYEVLQKAQ